MPIRCNSWKEYSGAPRVQSLHFCNVIKTSQETAPIQITNNHHKDRLEGNFPRGESRDQSTCLI